MKFVKLATTAIALVLSSSVNAALVSTDWNSTGDNLITRDTTSGLDWLDLAETINMSYETVNTQLGSGGAFEGFRFATSAEVVDLWANFGVNLAAGAATYNYGFVDPGIIEATSLLGNTITNDVVAYGALGMSADGPNDYYRDNLGAYYINALGSDGPQYHVVDYSTRHVAYPSDQVGSYLVQTSVVPIPAAVWLFGSGLVGLIGVARRNTNKPSTNKTPIV